MLQKIAIIVGTLTFSFFLLACEMIQPQASRPSVVIASPPSGSVYSVGEQVVVQSSASDPARILRVELIVDGVSVRQDSTPIATGQEQFSLLQTWTADKVGQRNLIVRATNAQGAVAETGIYVTVQENAAAPTNSPTNAPTNAPTAIPPTDIPTQTTLPSPTTNPAVTVIVTATGEPTQTAQATSQNTTTPTVTTTTNSESASCTDNSTFVADVTIPDGTNFSPNAAFTKTWRVRNTGTCNWQNYQLAFSSGAQLGSPTTVPVPATAAGATADINVPLKAPATFGNYKGTWRLRNAKGTLFGTSVTVLINVPNPNVAANATATTVPPTLPAAATCSGQPANFTFTANPTNINAGQSVTLNWGAVSNASFAVLNGGQFSNQGVGAPGSITAAPTSTTTYTLTATCNNGGGTRSNSVTVSVSGSAAACSGTPVINNFSASSTNVRPNEQVLFTWSTPTNADKLHFKGPGMDAYVPSAGSAVSNPLVTNPFTLTATCTASGKSVEQTITVTVTPWCTGTSVIGSFTASATTISPGQSVSLRWTGITNSNEYFIFAEGEPAPIVQAFAPVAPSGSMAVSPGATTIYTLAAYCRQRNSSGEAARQVTVTVSNAPPACAGDIGNFVFDGSSESVRDAQFLTIKPGESVALEWSAITNVDKVHFFGGGFDDDVSYPGIRIVTPTQKTTYDLTASCSANGNSIHGSVTVDVKP